MSQTAGYVFNFFLQMYGYREYLIQSVLRDLRTKYKRSFLGYVWTMLHPLAMMAIISVVFSHIMRMPTKDYAVFLFAGLLPWNYFNSTAMMSLHSIRANARLFGQIPVPKYIFILSLAFSNLVNFFLAIVPLLLVMLVTSHNISWTILAFPLVLLPLFCVVIGVSLMLATANVFFDDTLHLTEVAMQALYFLSPVLYHRDVLPEWLVEYLVLNPLFCQIEFIRGIFYDGVLPNPETFALNLLASTGVLLLGLIVFKKSEDKFLYFV
jgi:ABC-type polysaccharide/polyol phosphate export permease